MCSSTDGHENYSGKVSVSCQLLVCYQYDNWIIFTVFADEHVSHREYGLNAETQTCHTCDLDCVADLTQ